MKMTAEVAIDAPPEQVWARLIDLSTAPAYVPYLVSARPLTSGPPAVGALAELKFEAGTMRADGRATITALDAPRRQNLRVEVASLHIVMDVAMELAAVGGGSRLTQEAAIRFTSPFMKVMGPGMLRQKDPDAHLRQGLERFKALVEAG